MSDRAPHPLRSPRSMRVLSTGEMRAVVHTAGVQTCVLQRKDVAGVCAKNARQWTVSGGGKGVTWAFNGQRDGAGPVLCLVVLGFVLLLRHVQCLFPF